MIFDGHVDGKIQSGIYSIIHVLSGKRYIGSSRNIYNRLLSHRKELRKNIHPNDYLQKAWNRYGELSFKFEIIEDDICISSLVEKESEYIIKFGIGDLVTGKLFRAKGYNFCWPGKEGFKDAIIRKRIKMEKKNIRHKAWDDICYSYQCHIYEYNNTDPRIPLGWHPDKKKWEEFTYGWQYELYKRNDPKVPFDWKPNELELTPWNQLSYDYQFEIYSTKKNDSRIPHDWLPKSASRVHIIKDFKDLCYSYQLELYKNGSDRIPVGWLPRRKPKLN